MSQIFFIYVIIEFCSTKFFFLCWIVVLLNNWVWLISLCTLLIHFFACSRFWAFIIAKLSIHTYVKLFYVQTLLCYLRGPFWTLTNFFVTIQRNLHASFCPCSVIRGDGDLVGPLTKVFVTIQRNLHPSVPVLWYAATELSWTWLWISWSWWSNEICFQTRGFASYSSNVHNDKNDRSLGSLPPHQHKNNETDCHGH